MAEEECNTFASKKRAAVEQLSRGVDPDVEDDAFTQEKEAFCRSGKEEPMKDHCGEDTKEVKSDKKPKSGTSEQKPTPVKPFQELSSARNAFRGMASTGFSQSLLFCDTTLKPFGSIPNFHSCALSLGPPTGTNSLFGSGQGSNGSSLTSGIPDTTKSGDHFELFGAASSRSNLTSGSGFGALQEVAIEIGEEKGNLVFIADASLFEYRNGGWKERGKGELNLNKLASKTQRARFIMRAHGTCRLILNANLYPDMKLTSIGKRGVSFACVNNVEQAEGALAMFAIKFKDRFIVDEFQAAVEAHKGRSPCDLRSPEISPKLSEHSERLADTTEC